MKETELYSQLKKIAPASFLNFFKEAKSSAFRLELLNAYAVAEETEALNQFGKGIKTPSHGFNHDWISLIEELALRNVKMQRVRLIEEPVSEYLKFEIMWGYRLSVPAGEEIRIVDNPSMRSLIKTVPIVKDFWIFDDKTCVFLEYDFMGRFIGLQQLPDEETVLYKKLKQTIWEQSRNIKETRYWELLGND